MTHTFDYCSNLVYEDGELIYLLNPAGRAIPGEEENEFLYEYFLYDHLGNVRVVFGDHDRDQVAEVLQENHYYPFGMTMGGLNFAAGLENRFLYQGKEITSNFNLWWSDFHARRFDSQLGRWHVPDPIGQFSSPYVGMGNNPVIFTDPDGRELIGGIFRWAKIDKHAEEIVRANREALMEGFYEQMEQERKMFILWNSIMDGDGTIGQGGAGQPEDGSNLGDPPGKKDDLTKKGEQTEVSNHSPNNSEFDNWMFYTNTWATLMSESARGNIFGLSFGFSVLGGVTGSYDNITQAREAYQKGDYEKFTFEVTQAALSVGGLVMLFIPYTSAAGAWMITGNAAVDIGEYWYEKR
jgi:RHS repeat-associated protein